MALSSGESWESRILDVKVNRTCSRCNNGWINDLDGAASKHIAPCMRGEPYEIKPGTPQTLISVWCVKTAMLLELAHPGRGSHIPQEDYGYFYKHRHPPPGTYVWLGAYNSGEGEMIRPGWTRTWDIQFHLPDGTDRDGYALTFQVGYFVAQLVGHVGPDDLNIAQTTDLPDRSSVDFILPIWPPPGFVRWPPKVAFNAEGLEHLSIPTPSDEGSSEHISPVKG